MDYSTVWQNEMLVARSESERANAVAYAENTDLQLVELILTGDEIAFEHVFDRHKRLVAVVAGRYFPRPEQIEEIVQISFTKAFLELKNFRGDHERSLAVWLGRIAANACLDLIRRQKRKPESLLCELSDAESESLFNRFARNDENAEDFLIGRDLADKLLANLRADDRALLQMFYEEEMSVGEISEATGWSKSKVKLRTFRARSLLRKALRKFV